MSGLNAEQRGDMAEALLPEAAGLVVDVHEGSADDIKTRLMGLSRHELEAVAVLLAAMADPDRGLADALSWVDFDEHGAAIMPEKTRSTSPVRDHVPVVRAKHFRAGVDVVAVNRALRPDGHSVPLTRDERRLAVQVGIRRGMTKAEVAVRLGMSEDAVDKSWQRNKLKELGTAA